MNQEITCPKCSHTFALDQALNREIEFQLRAELSDEFKRKKLIYANNSPKRQRES